jgi:hypothetical protein
MTTWTPDSIPEIASHCPACTPDLDPESYVLAWCRAHRPDLGGSGDEIAKVVLGQDYLSGTGEAGGEASRAISMTPKPSTIAPRILKLEGCPNCRATDRPLLFKCAEALKQES